MEKISFEVIATDATIKPDDYRNIRVEVDGVNLSDLIENIDDNESVLSIIDVENIAEWISSENKLTEMLGYFNDQEVFEYLRSNGWDFGEK
ncbi:hypothetical protein FMK81_13155 [Klebsiella oxytoca]|uniref:hypothetical protein n=1 Tax=Klebsiella oxytoca TaxID=571 RepID=UPI001CCD6373|nr:hypothetical protein [Klebsiella oxytoca]MBZ7262455.1 hypothetical protein [Klebsiella oxytoca]